MCSIFSDQEEAFVCRKIIQNYNRVMRTNDSFNNNNMSSLYFITFFYKMGYGITVMFKLMLNGYFPRLQKTYLLHTAQNSYCKYDFHTAFLKKVNK